MTSFILAMTSLTDRQNDKTTESSENIIIRCSLRSLGRDNKQNQFTEQT